MSLSGCCWRFAFIPLMFLCLSSPLFFFFFFFPSLLLACLQNQSVNSRTSASVSVTGLHRRGASFMSTSLSFNNQTMMDGLHPDIHLKATSECWKSGVEKETHMHASCELEAGSFSLPVLLFLLLTVASRVQADSSSCLFSWFIRPELTSVNTCQANLPIWELEVVGCGPYLLLMDSVHYSHLDFTSPGLSAWSNSLFTNWSFSFNKCQSEGGHRLCSCRGSGAGTDAVLVFISMHKVCLWLLELPLCYSVTSVM